MGAPENGLSENGLPENGLSENDPSEVSVSEMGVSENGLSEMTPWKWEGKRQNHQGGWQERQNDKMTMTMRPWKVFGFGIQSNFHPGNTFRKKASLSSLLSPL